MGVVEQGSLAGLKQPITTKMLGLTFTFSQGNVATCLRCGLMFKYEFVANLPVSLPVKEF